MDPVKVKPIAVPVFLKRKKQCLVPKGYVHARKETFYRPIAVKFNSANLGAYIVGCELVDYRPL